MGVTEISSSCMKLVNGRMIVFDAAGKKYPNFDLKSKPSKTRITDGSDNMSVHVKARAVGTCPHCGKDVNGGDAAPQRKRVSTKKNVLASATLKEYIIGIIIFAIFLWVIISSQ